MGIKYLHAGKWLGCSHKHGHFCYNSGCPGLTFPAEKAHCFGEIFRIYKRRGSGLIRVGDEVGIYYIHTGKWVSAWDRDGGLSGCPKLPSHRRGMNVPLGRCKGELFKVYALGKSKGMPLEDKDTILLNYPHGFNEWYSLWNGRSRKSSCPGAAYPPPESKYESCRGETFEIRELNFYHIGK